MEARWWHLITRSQVDAIIMVISMVGVAAKGPDPQSSLIAHNILGQNRWAACTIRGDQGGTIWRLRTVV